MSEILSYVVESSILLAIFYMFYVLLFRRETFFQFNRIVLLAIPILSLFIPLIRFEFSNTPATIDQPLEKLTSLSVSYFDAMASWEYEVGRGAQVPEVTSGAINWIQILIALAALVYISGVIICLSRTVWSIRWIAKALSNHPFIEKDGVKVVKLSHPTAPFSFMSYVFVHAPFVESSDFQQVLEHERIHIEEKHTIDLLYVQFVAALFWFNPVIWQLFKSLKTVHEYIADRKIIQLGYSVVEYQSLLLRQLISNNSGELVHNFNLSFIKKRITMMTNRKSGWAGRARISLAITAMTLCGLMIIQCNTRIDDQMALSEGISGSPSSHIDLPIIPASDFRFDGDLSDALTFTISDNTLYIGEKKSEISDIGLIQGDDYGRRLPIVMMVDKDQEMGFMRKVQMALRVADRRKLLYLGQTSSGERVELVLILPPDPNSLTYQHPDISKVPEKHLLKIDLGAKDASANQKKVYDFVTSFLANGEAELPVVSARMEDEKTYKDYLLNYFYIKEAYIQIYQERARRMFGKDFYKTTKEEYQKVRENIPMNISIAED